MRLSRHCGRRLNLARPRRERRRRLRHRAGPRNGKNGQPRLRECALGPLGRRLRRLAAWRSQLAKARRISHRDWADAHARTVLSGSQERRRRNLEPCCFDRSSATRWGRRRYARLGRSREVRGFGRRSVHRRHRNQGDQARRDPPSHHQRKKADRRGHSAGTASGKTCRVLSHRVSPVLRARK